MDFYFIFKKNKNFLAAILVCFLALLGGRASDAAEPDDGSPWYVPVKAVAVITEDDQGLPLKFPSSVFFDRTMDEIYVVGGGNGRIIVYGSDYFPKISLGAGRGVDSPNGIYVASDGKLFVCQGRTAQHPPRLTILNAAFFPVQEVDMPEFPGAENFVPNRVSVGHKGRIYITGINFRGVLVLNSSGEFLRWLKPVDKIWVEETEETGEDFGLTTSARKTVEENVRQDSQKQDEVVEEDLHEAEMANMPDFLNPKKKSEPKVEEETKDFGPVQVTDVVCDTEGHVYLLSEETSKVYVYNQAEEFLFSFGKKGGSSGKLSRPRGLVVDEKKKSIYVVDYMRHSVLIFNFAGRFLFEIGGKGRAPRWFNFPTALALNRQGNLVVADLFNQRVQVLDVQYEAGVSLFGPGSQSDSGGK